MAESSAHVLVIAEAGVNHNGNLATALKLVDAAANAGADIVKFQTFRAENLVTHYASKASYQASNMKNDNDDTQLGMLKRLELNKAEHMALMERCKQKGIGFLSTPFDFESVDMLSELGVTIWKIPSGEITNLLLLRKIGSKGQRIIMSTGMSTLTEIEDALRVLESAGTPRSAVTLLHCTTQYPAPVESVNLKAMLKLKEFGCNSVGYSDHTRGITVPIAATALGAKVIEKHFTLSRNIEGPDHKASLEPDELKEMVAAIRLTETALGDGKKEVAEAERPNMAVARKSIVASRHINRGEIFSEENLTVKRPGTGISPMKWDEVVGRQSSRDFEADECISI